MENTNLQAETPAEGAPVLSDDNAEQAAPPTAPDESPENATPDDAGKPEPSKGAGKRIDELTRNWRSTERERDYWREMAMRSTPQPAKAEEPAAPAVPSKTPTLADFEYDESKYQAALLEYTRAEARREAEAVLAERERKQAEAEQVKVWRERVSEFSKTKPDFNEVVGDPTLPISDAMTKVIAASEIGPELAYTIASDRELAEQIYRMSADGAAHAIGRIEGRLLAQRELAKASPPPAVTKAPPPPPKIEAVEPDVRVRTTDPSGDALSDEEWVRMERKRVSKRR